MFTNGDLTVREVAEQIQKAEDETGFKIAVYNLKTCLKQLQVEREYLLEVERRAYYLTNQYSQKDTMERMRDAKQRVMAFIDHIMDNTVDEDMLLKVMENFYLFLEALLEREPHSKGGIQKGQLETLRIKNEYDVQYLLLAYLRPLYPMARSEVSEDTGYNTVRVDIEVDAKNVIEVKCTRKGMTKKRLIEEIEADMVHYGADGIYFFVYDKEKIIDNPLNFKNTYEKKIVNKQIHIIIHQPKIL